MSYLGDFGLVGFPVEPAGMLAFSLALAIFYRARTEKRLLVTDVKNTICKERPRSFTGHANGLTGICKDASGQSCCGEDNCI